MKRLFFAFVFLVIAQLGFSNYSAMKIKLRDINQFMVVVDDQVIGKFHGQGVIGPIPAGNHVVKILQLSQSNYWNPPTQHLVFAGDVFFQPNTIASVVIHPNFSLEVLSVHPYNYAPAYDQGNPYAYNNYYPVNNHYDLYYYNESHYPVNNHSPAGGSCTSNNHEHYEYIPQTYQEVDDFYQEELHPMHPQDFELLKQSIQSQWFSRGKMQVFKSALHHNYFTTRQVRLIMEMFSFERDRLEVAKVAYTSVVDTHNYYQVNNAFDFGRSVTELSDFIASL